MQSTYDGNNVDLLIQFFHANQINGFQAVSGWANKIQADVDTGVVVRRQRTFDFQFFLQVIFKLGVDVIHDCLETVFLVYLIAITDSVANC